MKQNRAKPRSTPSTVNPSKSMLVSVPAFSFPLSTVVACAMDSVVVEVAVGVNVLVVIMLLVTVRVALSSTGTVYRLVLTEFLSPWRE